MSADFHHARRGRRPANIIALACLGIVLTVLWAIDTHILFMLIFVFPAVILCVELFRNTESYFSLTADTLSWGRGAKQSDMSLTEIEEVRLLRRLDLSQVVELRFTTGQKFRLPYDVTPPIKPLEEALQARGISVSRHMFSFL